MPRVAMQRVARRLETERAARTLRTALGGRGRSVAGSPRSGHVQVDRREHVLEPQLELVQHRERHRETDWPAREAARHRASTVPDSLGEPFHGIELAGHLTPHERETK